MDSNVVLSLNDYHLHPAVPVAIYYGPHCNIKISWRLICVNNSALMVTIDVL